MKNLNILYHFRTRGTGAEGVHIAGIANAFRKLGNTVDFSSPNGTDPTRTAGNDPFADAGKRSLLSKVTRMCPDFAFEFLELLYNLFAYRRIRRRLKQKSYDLVYERHAFFLFATAKLAQKFHIPYVVEVNELVGDARIRKQPLLSFVARWTDLYTFRRADVIVVVSPHLKRRIVERGIDASKILVLPNAVEAEKHSNCADGSNVRREYQLEDSFVIGFVGWLVHWHRLEDLVECAADLASKFADVRLLLVGEGPLRTKLEEIAIHRNFSDGLIITGAVPHDHVSEHIAAMDVAVIPHSNEYRSPIKLFEYMVQARPVLAVRTEPIEMVVTEGQNGLLFEPENNEDMQRGIEQLIQGRELRSRLGNQAREDVLQRHTWTQNAKQILDVITPEGLA